MHCAAVCLHNILGCCFAVCWKPSVLGETSITLHEFIKWKMYRKPLFPYPDDLEHAKISQLIKDQVGIIFVASFSHVWLDTSHVPVSKYIRDTFFVTLKLRNFFHAAP